jgi:membrane-associated phospholipid phosphatase
LTRPHLRPSEWLWVAFLAHAVVLGLWRGQAVLAAGVLTVFTGAAIASLEAPPPSPISVVRDWAPVASIVLAYWSADLARALPANREMQQLFVGWDRVVLDEWGMHHAVEWLRPGLPLLLETSYLLVYAIPPLAVASFYVGGHRDRIEDFLFPFLLGTLTAYALLPHFPSEGPRLAFPGQNLPSVTTLVRRLNLWILDHCDIRSSVFPSGHVAVVSSAAAAMYLAAPERRVVWITLVILAALVWTATVYGRYHYAADGLASVAISCVAAVVVSLARRRTRRLV